jgi:hypothetical protein
LRAVAAAIKVSDELVAELKAAASLKIVGKLAPVLGVEPAELFRLPPRKRTVR